MATTELQPVSGISSKELARHARARTAYLAALKMKREWQSVARFLSRNPKLKLELSPDRSCTDGNTIYIKVPMELGDLVEHSPGTCGKRDSNQILICPRCSVLEEVHITIIHEVAHIVEGTFDPIEDFDKVQLIKKAIELECGGDRSSTRAKTLINNINAAPPHLKRDYLNLANLVNPFMPLIINACEDIRVNALMQQSRPGTRVMFQAHLNKVFEEGIYRADGTYYRWIESPPNAQALIGVYCLTWDLPLEGKILPEIAEKLLGSEELTNLVSQMQTSKTVRDIYRLSFPVLEALRKLGFMLSPEDPPEDPQEPESEPEVESESGPGNPGSSGNPGGSSNNSGNSDKGDTTKEPENEPDEDIGSSEQESPDSFNESESEDSGADSEDSEFESQSSNDPTNPPTDDQDTSFSGSDSNDDETNGESVPPLDSDPNLSDKDTGETNDYTYEDMQRDGLPEEVESLFLVFGGHGEKVISKEDRLDEKALAIAINQVEFFDRPSLRIDGTKVYRYNPSCLEAFWQTPYYSYRTKNADENPITIPNKILAPSLQKLRLLFTNNSKGKFERNLKSGKVNTPVLARRIPVEDDRVFRKVTHPGKKDYFVLIGIDCSGSTSFSIPEGIRLDLIKTAALAKAELLHRLGIKFAVYVHSGDSDILEIGIIKEAREPWGPNQRNALLALQPYNANLDGHTLEFYRKIAQRESATDKLILYYTDGHMPAENYSEELEILQSEIQICQKLGINLAGIGVNTDSPTQHGLDTIRLDTIEDVPKVIDELRKRIK